MWEIKVHDHGIRGRNYSRLAQADAIEVVSRGFICAEQNCANIPPKRPILEGTKINGSHSAVHREIPPPY